MNDFHYTLGLDVGISSIGWSVIKLRKDDKTVFAPELLVDTGVRIFPTAEVPKTGESLNLKRRNARGLRRRLRRKRIRLREIKKILIDAEILVDSKNLYSISQNDLTPWEIRVKALEEKVSNEELARAILHIAKHRGFKSNRKVDLKETAGKSEDQMANAAIAQNDIALREYRSVAEMVVKDSRFKSKKRNSPDNYKAVVLRKHLMDELQLVLITQLKLGNQKITSEVINKVITIASSQLPFGNKEQIKKLIGYCTYYPNEQRISKGTLSGTEFVLWDKINNTYYRTIGSQIDRAFTVEQKQKIAELAFTKNEVTYWDIRKLLELPSDILFSSVNYYKKKAIHQETEGEKSIRYENSSIEEIEKDKKSATFIQLKAYHELRRSLEKELPDLWHRMNSDHILFDTITEELVYNKDDESLKSALLNIQPELSDIEITKLIDIKVSPSLFKPLHVSRKAIHDLLPYFKQGQQYKEAEMNGIPEEIRKVTPTKAERLSSINLPEIRNPVVLRAVSQLRKLINAITREYGQPTYVNIEFARDMARNFSDRMKLHREHEDNRTKNENLINELRETYGVIDPKGFDILKLKLWRAQGGRCAYSMQTIDVRRLFSDEKYAEVDHILPFSRTLDDSKSNKVLVLSSENQQKRNMTPYEYIHSRNSKQWDEIVTWWKTLPELSSKRLEKLLTEHLDVTDRRRFIERDINDTRYIARAIKNYIEDNLLFKPADVIRRVYTFNGKFTSVLRARYGLNKDRDLNNRHHALDAILIGIADDSMLQKISDYSKGDENFQSITEKDKKRFPLPWDNFRDDVYIRVFDENPEQQLENLQIIKHYGEYRKFIRPLFVSWMVDKKVTGAAHEETVYSIKEVNGRDMLVVKKPVSSLKVSDLANIYGEDPALKMALIDHSNKYPDTKGKLAFAKDAPRIYKPSESGQANEIKSVKVICGPATNYVNIHKGKGVAPQSSMIRVDIFKKYGKHYFIPIYVHHTTGKELPNKVVSRQNIQVDDSFDFLFSVYPNEYLVLSDKGNVIAEGYYAKANSNNGQFTLRSHDYSKPEQTPTIQNRDSLRKFTVNLLGYKYEIKQEKRHGFSSRRHNETI